LKFKILKSFPPESGANSGGEIKNPYPFHKGFSSSEKQMPLGFIPPKIKSVFPARLTFEKNRRKRSTCLQFPEISPSFSWNPAAFHWNSGIIITPKNQVILPSKLK
jgi:hypothetical protein